jgi:mRNA-degrading endonuclease RelE of RelBE toxin-antitoxin system
MNSFSIHKDIRKFIKSLPKEESSKVVWAIKMLEIKEYKIEMPFSRKIENDLYELRIKSFKNIRLFYDIPRYENASVTTIDWIK